MQLSAASCLLLAVCAGCASARGNPPEGLGKTSVSFEAVDLSGKTVKSSDFQGRVLLIDFWATWCKPCETSMPFYASLHEKLGGEGLTVLAISVDESDKEEAVNAWVDRHELPFVVLRDPDGKVARAFDEMIETMPTAIVVGRDGKVRLVHAGFESGDEEEIEREVRAALSSAPSAS